MRSTALLRKELEHLVTEGTFDASARLAKIDAMLVDYSEKRDVLLDQLEEIMQAVKTYDETIKELEEEREDLTSD